MRRKRSRDHASVHQRPQADKRFQAETRSSLETAWGLVSIHNRRIHRQFVHRHCDGRTAYFLFDDNDPVLQPRDGPSQNITKEESTTMATTRRIFDRESYLASNVAAAAGKRKDQSTALMQQPNHRGRIPRRSSTVVPVWICKKRSSLCPRA